MHHSEIALALCSDCAIVKVLAKANIEQENNMTAKAAALALVTFDTDLACEVSYLNTGDYWWIEGGARERQEAVLKYCAGTWTLSLAAASAGVTETQVLVALAKNHLHCGTQVVCEGVVKNLLK